MTRRLFNDGPLAMAIATLPLLSVAVAGQEPPRPVVASKAQAHRSYAPPRTPCWTAARTPAGASVWSCDSLVIETTNFKDRSTYRNANAATLRLIERLTRTAPDRIEWAVTVDDRTTWTRPWTFSMPLTMDDREPVLEFARHEGNYAVPNILSAARTAERDNARAATTKP